MASGGRSIRGGSVPAAKVIGALGVGAAGVLGLCSTAAAAEPTQQELVDQIKALQQKVEQLEARQNSAESQPTTRSADDQSATVGSVLRDADLRSNPPMLQPEGFTAGYSRGKFLIQDASGNFVLNPNLQLQARYILNYRE